MLVKFFSNRNGGSDAGIDYLLDSRVQNGVAYVIKGSESITRQIVANITKKQKLCMGCLSFEEANIDLNTKQKIIDEFENLLFGSYGDRYNILWVQHGDKGRLELNFVIPKIDLQSRLAFNPYFHASDMKLFDAWQNCINLRFDLFDPKDPEKAHMLQGSRKELKAIKDYIELEKILTEKFINGEFESRDDVLKALKDSDVEVTRVGKDYVSVKLPNSKKAKRFKGVMFDEEFRDIKSLEQLRSEAEARAAKFKSSRDDRAIRQTATRSFIFADELATQNPREFRIIKFKSSLSNRDRKLNKLKQEFNRQAQKRSKWLEKQADRKPRRKFYKDNSIDDIGYSVVSGQSLDMETEIRQQDACVKQQRNAGIYQAKFKWRTIVQPKIYTTRRYNDFIRADIIRRIRGQREARERENKSIATSLDSIADFNRQSGAATRRVKEFARRTRGFANQARRTTKFTEGFADFIRDLASTIRANFAGIVDRLVDKIYCKINYINITENDETQQPARSNTQIER